MTANKPKLKGQGFRLPGMVAVDKSVSSGLSLSERLDTMLSFSTSSIIKVTVGKQTLDGEAIHCQDSAKAEAKLSEIRGYCSRDKGFFFVCFGYEGTAKSEKKVMLVSFIPEDIQVKDKMLMSSSKGVLKQKLIDKNSTAVVEEYNCTELKEVSEEVYNKKKNVEKPLTEAEKMRLEEDKAEKAGGYNLIARLKEMEDNNNAYSLPGFGIGMKPSEVKKNRVASMNIARSKDEERKEKIDFLVKLREEKEKMEAEQKAEALAAGRPSALSAPISVVSGPTHHETKPQLREISTKSEGEKHTKPAVFKMSEDDEESDEGGHIQ